MNTSNSETEVISNSSIVKTTDNTINTVDESVDKPADESVDKPADEPTDKPADESIVPADESVVPADESVVPTDRTTERKPRYAKSSINVKVNFRKTTNTPTNPRANNDEYKNALIQASDTFFSECILSNNDFIEKEKAKINRFGNKYTPTIVHKVSYDKDFEPQQIGNQTIVFSRKHFVHNPNQIFIKRLIREYENIFQECDWVNIKDSTRANEPNTLLIIIGKNKN
jgi:hypothetical protein